MGILAGIGAIGGLVGGIASIFGGGGPSRAEKDAAARQTSLAQMLAGYASQQYGEQQGIFNNLTSILNPIAAAGPNQQGFNAAELNALNTNAMNTTAGNYASAARKVGSELAGGGTSAGPSGVQQQIEGTIAAQGAGQAAQEENQIQLENYNVGRENWQNAMEGLNRVGSELNPTTYSDLAQRGMAESFNEAGGMNQEKNQHTADIWSGIGGAVGSIPGLVGLFSHDNNSNNTSTPTVQPPWW